MYLEMIFIWNIRVMCWLFTEIWGHKNKMSEFHVMMQHQFPLQALIYKLVQEG